MTDNEEYELEYNEELGLSQFEAFRSPEALAAFIHDLEEEDRMLKSGEIRTYTSEEVWGEIDEMIGDSYDRKDLR